MMLTNFLRTVYIPSRPDLSASAVYQFGVTIRRFEAWAGRPIEIETLTDELLCRFLMARQQAGRSPATVNSNRSKLLSLWRCAWRKRMHHEQPRDVPRRREPQRTPLAWTDEEVAQLLDYTSRLNGTIDGLQRRYYWSSLILVVWNTAARIGAVRGVTPDRCDLAEGWIHLRAEEQKQNADQLFRLSESTVNTIRHIYDTSRPLVWPWPYCHRQFWVRFRRIVERAGLTAGKTHDLFHKLRRSSLSYVAAHDLELARQQAGHSTSRLTLRSYIDPRIARQRSAVDVLPELKVSGDKQLRLF